MSKSLCIFKHWLRSVKNGAGLIDRLFLPHGCALCARHPATAFLCDFPSLPLCTPCCEGGIHHLAQPRCPLCGRGVVAETPACLGCQSDPPPWPRLLLGFQDAGAPARLLRSAKKGGERALVLRRLGALWGQRWGEHGLAGVTIVPMAGSITHLRQRGLGVVTRIAWGVGDAVGGKVIHPLLPPDTTQSQRGRRRSQRLKLPQRIFQARPPAAGEDPRVVLIDDLLVTGTTLRRAATALVRAGWVLEGAGALLYRPRWREEIAALSPAAAPPDDGRLE
ncbi:MAG: hypothetical protein COX57_09375 [Alphaproteobacteria bacterium CG_4_10_14_0_2_um_filter_63_37]|nr:MAG: hypothetical protein AUJ55_02290 [Proteobacteria bacterium CG1_02_64_396]PJA24273.1 MAG: hypothetical protein COX57_09375 [Alphaproteobacteria bacterium CG_4_10_14_0_2_um_filter_63_37]